MSDTTKLALSVAFFIVTGLYLLVMPAGMFVKMIGAISLVMAAIGGVAAHQKSKGQEFRDIFTKQREKVSQRVSGRGSAITGLALSAGGQKRLERALTVMNSFGIFAPLRPTTNSLKEAVAGYGEPVTVDAVLHALDEACFYHPEFQLKMHNENLVFLPSDGEQSEHSVEQQVLQVVGLSGGKLRVGELTVHASSDQRTAVKMMLNDEAIAIDYNGSVKNLSTTVTVEIAKRYRAMDNGSRLACLWSDQGVFIMSLTDGAVPELNKALGKSLTKYSAFGWLDEESPFDATSMQPIN